MKKIFIYGLTVVLTLVGTGWSATPKAVDLEILDFESSLYILLEDGTIQTAGFAEFRGNPQNIQAVDLTFTRTQEGYYVLDSDGTVYSFGDAVILSNPLKDKERNPYVDMELFRETDSPYFLRQDGTIIAVGEAVFYGDQVRKEHAVDMELTRDGLGYYVLYEDGVIAFFGSAIDYGFTETGKTKAVDLEIVPGGYYVLLEDGSILNFNEALPLPFRIKPSADVVDMTLTEEGYRVLSTTGDVQSFIRVDRQGSARWFAQIAPAAQSKPQQTATPTPTARPDQPYFTFEEKGFSEKIVARVPEGSFLPASLNSGYTSLFGGGLFVAASDGEELPARKVLFFSLTESKGEDSTGSLFAQLTPERGGAVIRGLAYSQAGLYTVIEDKGQFLIFLLEGDYGESDIRAFSLY